MEETWQKLIQRGRGGGGGVIATVEGKKSENTDGVCTEGPGQSRGNVVQDQMTAKHGHDVAVSYLAKNSNNFESPQKNTGFHDLALHAYSKEYYTGYDAFSPTFNTQYSPQCHFNRYTWMHSVQNYFHPMAYSSHGYYREQTYGDPFMQQGRNVGVNVSQQRNDYSFQYIQTRPTCTESHDKPVQQILCAPEAKTLVAPNQSSGSNTDG